MLHVFSGNYVGGNQQPYALEWTCMDNWWRVVLSFRRKHSPSPLFFPRQTSHSIFDLSLPVFKGNQQNIFQIYAWNNTSKSSWKPRTMDSNEFLIILNFTVFLPSLLTTVGPQVINYLSLSFESYIFFKLLFISSALFSYPFISLVATIYSYIYSFTYIYFSE